MNSPFKLAGSTLYGKGNQSALKAIDNDDTNVSKAQIGPVDDRGDEIGDENYVEGKKEAIGELKEPLELSNEL